MTHNWFYSEKTKELYHHDEGNFEAHAKMGHNEFQAHHTLKVLPTDAIKVVIERTTTGTLRIREKMEWFHSKRTDKLYRIVGDHQEQYCQDATGAFS